MALASCFGVVLASFLVMIIFFSMVTSAVTGIVKSFKGDNEQKEIKLSDESVLLLDLEGAISDLPTNDIYKELAHTFEQKDNKNYTLQEVLRAINVARENPEIDAIVLKLGKATMGYATASEIRNALLSFKESGKPIYAYSGTYMYGNYYVSSVADKLYASPEGSLFIRGLASTVLFKKGLMEKLGVEMEIYRVGTFKSAVEPFMLDKLSAENRLQIETYLNGLWQNTTSEIAKSRNISTDVIQEFADEGEFMSFNKVGYERGLIDSLVYQTDIEDVLSAQITGDKNEEINYLSVSDMLFIENRSLSNDKIAVIFAEGTIVSAAAEESNNPFQQNNHIGNEIAEKLREVADDEEIDAVVLRVNSPGGSLDMSELIAREVEQLKKSKPIVVSMGDVAASGGYYISSHASSIVAMPNTITGSIGIYGMLPNFAGTMKKLALKTDVVKTAEMADFPNAMTPSSPKEKAVMQKMIEQGYAQFINRVATGRNMTPEEVDKVAQGRVWLGSKAIELGLVDKLGGLEVAIDEAARLAGIEGDYKVVRMIDKEDIWSQILGLNLSATLNYLTMSYEERMMWHGINHFNRLRGIQAVPPFTLEIKMDGVDNIETYLSL